LRSGSQPQAARSGTTKPIPMVVSQFEEFVELNLHELEELLTSSLPNVVFSDL
jgi:hypothetical protein